MNLTKKVCRIIERKLSWTNGWAVEKEEYYKLCLEATEEILNLPELRKGEKLK